MNTNPNNVIQFMQLLKYQKNPQQIVINMLQQTNNNPIAQNLLSMAQSGNVKGIEQVAKNIMKEKGLDFDTEFNNFKKNLGF